MPSPPLPSRSAPARAVPALRVVPLTRAHALDICTWRYSPPDDCYDMTGADPDRLLEPQAGFHAVLAGDRLVGFRSFGADGQVPGWRYDDSALDTGGGLRPELVGKGLGRAAVSAGLAFGRARSAPRAFRVTVASSNTRALRVVGALGFERVGRFEAITDGRPFDVLVRAEGAAAAASYDRPEIVCICGSARFWTEMREVDRELTLAGAVVVAPDEVDGAPDPAQKAALDALHLRKIDLADRVLVVNPGGYVGESTRREIAYARAAGKPVAFTCPG